MILITVTWYLKHLACPPLHAKFCFELVSLTVTLFNYMETRKRNTIKLTIAMINLICSMKKDTETLVENTGTLYEAEGRLGPRQH